MAQQTQQPLEPGLSYGGLDARADGDPVSVLEVGHRLPCGHTLAMRLHSSPGAGDEWLTSTAKVLDYWVRDRASRHECALVAPENPLGLAPREKA